MAIQDLFQVSVAKHDTPSQEPMRLLARNFLKTFKQWGSDWRRTKLLYELIVVDGQQLPGLINASGDIKRSYSLLESMRGRGLIGEGECGERRRLAGLIGHVSIAICLFWHRKNVSSSCLRANNVRSLSKISISHEFSVTGQLLRKSSPSSCREVMSLLHTSVSVMGAVYKAPATSATIPATDISILNTRTNQFVSGSTEALPY